MQRHKHLESGDCMTPQHIIDAVSRETGLPAAAITSDRINEKLYLARHAVSYISWAHYRIPFLVLSKAFSKTGVTILKRRYRRALELLSDPEFERLINRSCVRLVGMEPNTIKSPVKDRHCLMCSGVFTSHHFGERLCPSCKKNKAGVWRSGYSA